MKSGVLVLNRSNVINGTSVDAQCTILLHPTCKPASSHRKYEERRLMAVPTDLSGSGHLSACG